MSLAMEEVQMGIYKNRAAILDEKQTSTRVQEVYSLSRWYRDVQERHAQLDKWIDGTSNTPRRCGFPACSTPRR